MKAIVTVNIIVEVPDDFTDLDSIYLQIPLDQIQVHSDGLRPDVNIGNAQDYSTENVEWADD